jgi:hypothetical protein
MGRLVRCCSAMLVVTTLVSCSSGGPSMPPFLLPGPTPTVYAGSVHDSADGDGTVRITLTTVSGVTTGTWTPTFGGVTQLASVIDGQVNANMFTGSVHPFVDAGSSLSGCTLSVTGTFSSSSFSGTYSTFAVTRSCPTADTGSFTAMPQ